jgi:ABC-type multidrug transport system fused ATPase/permease subunit
VSDLETNIVSVERIKEYTELASEADWESAGTVKPPADWPHQGVVNFEHYATRYRKGLDLVLRDINAQVNAGEKVESACVRLCKAETCLLQ